MLMTERDQAELLQALVPTPSATTEIFNVREDSLQPFLGFGSFVNQLTDGSIDAFEYFVLMIRHKETLPPLLLPASEIECGAVLTAPAFALNSSPPRSFIEATATIALPSNYKRVDLSDCKSGVDSTSMSGPS